MAKIILIEHHDNPRDDRATEFLTQQGFQLDYRYPFQGETLPEIDESIAGVVVYGGAANVTEMDEHPYLRDEIKFIQSCLETDTKVLGICLGAQLIAHALGAPVGPRADQLCEFGYYEITPTHEGQGWIPESFFVTQAHFQGFDLPEGAIKLAQGKNFENQAFRYGESAYGVQFHPEVNKTIFQRWQDSDWAFFDSPGAQSREQQDQIVHQADPIQGAWFKHFLEDFFGYASVGLTESQQYRSSVKQAL